MSCTMVEEAKVKAPLSIEQIARVCSVELKTIKEANGCFLPRPSACGHLAACTLVDHRCLYQV